MYANLRQRFKISGCVGRAYTSTNGILQGCPLSIILLNALISVWCYALKEETPDVQAAAYVDDTGAVAERPGMLNAALVVTKEFEELTGQEVSTSKSCCFSASSPCMKSLKFGEHKLPRVDVVKAVGVKLNLRSLASSQQASKRYDEAKDLALL
eukprot:7830142-Karenia_brevis.AAC.1